MYSPLTTWSGLAAILLQESKGFCRLVNCHVMVSISRGFEEKKHASFYFPTADFGGKTCIPSCGQWHKTAVLRAVSIRI